MTVAVVDALEFIGVHQQQDRFFELQLLQQTVIARAVDEPGQLVGLGLVGEAVLRCGAQAHDGQQAPDEQGEQHGAP